MHTYLLYGNTMQRQLLLILKASLNKQTKTSGLEVLFSFVLKKHMNHFQVHDNHETISRFQSQGNPLHNKVCFFFFFFELYSNYTSWIGKKSIPNFTAKSKNPRYFQRPREAVISIYILYLHNRNMYR